MGTRTPPPFERFLDANGPTVMRFLVAAVGPEHADDAYQETFLSALRAYPRVRDDGRLDRWILRIASRTAIDHHRARARRPEPSAAVPDRPLAGPEPPDESLLAAVASLPPKQRAAVALRHLLDRPYPEIAEILGCSEEAARANVRAGLATLRERVR
ncbi:MAG: RNA polymerase sigma factor [Actinomycetota bacterium]